MSDVRIFDNQVPTLGPGNYLLSVAQQVNPQHTDIDETFTAAQVFSVTGPRYSLPPEDVLSVFPPNDSRGVFGQFLPNIVLTKRDLPWERNAFDQQHDRGKRAPWLALLLFVENEKIGGGGALLDPKIAGEWTPNRLKTATVTAADMVRAHGDDGILWPDLAAEWYESADRLQETPCTIIDVSAQAFAALVPGPDELRWLAHVREIDPSHKDALLLSVNEDGVYSVVVGNRLPNAAGGRNIVHLVSLEGLTAYAGGAKPLPANKERVRMVSLRSWSFTCLAEPGESFAGFMKGLLADGRGTTFALTGDAAAQGATLDYAREALATGHVPMRWHTRLGEETFAWYRGPFTPKPVTKFDVSRAQSPSAAVVYDPTQGVFDVSYAVAFETGRMLALADGPFGQALLRLQRRMQRSADLLLERGNADRHTRTDAFVLDTLAALDVTTLGTKWLGGSSPARPLRHTVLPRATSLSALLGDATALDALLGADPDAASMISEWLGRRCLLEGVPFETLVPHASLLPPESVRFFYVDANWLQALMDGAMSISVQSSRDRLLHAAIRPRVHAAAQRTVAARRAKLLGKHASSAALRAAASPVLPVAGMLLRSGAVAGWPGLEVRGFTHFTPDKNGPKPDPSSALQPLRVERLGDNVLLALWATVPSIVTISEPDEGIAFGFEEPPKHAAPTGNWLYLRSVAANYGMPLCGDEDIEHGTCQYVLDVNKAKVIDANGRLMLAGADGLVAAISAALPGAPAIQPRDFAVQMIRVPERAVFASKPT